MKWIDLPPVWLFACLALAWFSPLTFEPGLWVIPGAACLIVGGTLMTRAMLEFVKTKTTIIPREEPTALITGGIFRFTRNPIYLGDVLFLAGASLILGSVVGLVLVPIFAIFLQIRFIQGEEAKLRATFGEAFETYAKSVRRWL